MTKTKKFTFTTHIEGDDGDETDVTVTARVTGRYIPAKMWGDDAHPAEYPDIDIETVEDQNGVDITEMIPEFEMDGLIEKAEVHLSEEEQ